MSYDIGTDVWNLIPVVSMVHSMSYDIGYRHFAEPAQHSTDVQPQPYVQTMLYDIGSDFWNIGS
eukprot:10993642-Karenia_brevis.AAC.1